MSMSRQDELALFLLCIGSIVLTAAFDNGRPRQPSVTKHLPLSEPENSEPLPVPVKILVHTLDQLAQQEFDEMTAEEIVEGYEAGVILYH
jgi:hypothetical protein